jgi:hypothetical protein
LHTITKWDLLQVRIFASTDENQSM